MIDFAVIERIENLDIEGKNVLVRGDFDVDDGDNPRANSIRNIVKFLMSSGANKIRVIGHADTNYDLAAELAKEFPKVEFDSGLRKDPREKQNDGEFAKELAEGWDIYVNESFATSHRQHTSIVALPAYFRATSRRVCVGLRFWEEIRMLSEFWNKSGRRVLVIGGTKVEDKERFVDMMKDSFSDVLKGGLLPGTPLREDGLDISEEAIADYVDKIMSADVILAAGVMGKYEDEGSDKGTRLVLEAIAQNAKAYKVAGGGDIEMAISKYNLTDKFDWISVGGGAMLEFLAKKTLPGIDALVG
jgi:phosphoglycerate kinase